MSELEVVTCRLDMTNRARKEIGRWIVDEHALFSMQDHFDVYIEKQPAKQDNMSFSFYFDPKTNVQLRNFLDGRVPILECVYKNEGFVATNFRVRGRRERVQTNRRYAARLKFALGSTGKAMPIQLYTALRELPIAEERSAYVEKRIKSWEGYLRIEEKNADVEDMVAHFSQPFYNEDFSKLTIVCSGLEAKDWNTIVRFSAKLKGQQEDIGTVIDVKRSSRKVKIELTRKSQAKARHGALLPNNVNEIVFSNFAQLSQIKRLRKGFKDLQDGIAANANLEKVLFEERPVVQITNKQVELEFHHPLNEFQREAVTGAMSAHDLYVIQGPPGTGKTTVISELCHQLVKAGQRTLVASQSNLAVDNALGRLLSDPGIRILRYGRTESIEEEGKRFIEENVALHWRDETFEAVETERRHHAEREREVSEEISRLVDEEARLLKEIEDIEQKIVEKQAAEAEHAELSKQHREMQTEKMELKRKETEAAEQLDNIRAVIETLKAETAIAEQKRKEMAFPSEMVLEMEEKQQRVAFLQRTLRYFQTEEAIEVAQSSVRRMEEDAARKTVQCEPIRQFLTLLAPVRKLQEVEDLFAALQLKPSLPISLEINALRKLRTEIQRGIYPYELREWSEVEERLVKGIDYAQSLLNKNSYPVEQMKPRQTDRFQTTDEMHEMLDQFGRYLSAKETKRQIAMQNNPAKLALLQRIAKNVAYLLGKKDDVEKRMAAIKASSNEEAANRFLLVKNEIQEEFTERLCSLEAEMTAAKEDVVKQIEEIANLKKEHAELAESVDEDADRNTIEREITALKKEISAFEDRSAKVTIIERSIVEKREALVEQLRKLEDAQNALDDILSKQLLMTENVVHVEERLDVLYEITRVNVEQMKKELLEEVRSIGQRKVELQHEQKRLPIIQELQEEWSGLLSEASSYDLDEIRKLYVKHANVIGTTCVASARKDFAEDYPDFDVVIIDEVSKATPPELLLPMLKGKKIILVGDHHQLPPLIGRETMEEFVDEINDETEKNELRSLLKESLFERLFRTLPKKNKTMLSIQYRMHEKIMDAIAPFYEEGNYRLRCGLDDSERVRDHFLHSRYFNRNDHLLWFDMPNEPDYFEAQVKGGTSLYNEAELQMIGELLEDLDEATEQAKREGRLPADSKKSVGIISFYGEQVKRIDRLIEQEIRPNHLHCRTGSVDKFQGMEMDVILLSFVRNHQQPSGTIGFAEDYRRLNVALSRARELLLIVGSSEMFTKRPKKAETREMYSRLVEQVRRLNGFRLLHHAGGRANG